MGECVMTINGSILYTCLFFGNRCIAKHCCQSSGLAHD